MSDRTPIGNVTVSKKTLYTIVAIIIIAVVAVALFAFPRQSSTDKVRIVQFTEQFAIIDEIQKSARASKTHSREVGTAKMVSREILAQ